MTTPKPLCADTQFNAGQPCSEYALYGKYGANNVKIVCRYCLTVLRYEMREIGKKPAAASAQPKLIPLEKKSEYMLLLKSGPLSDWEAAFLKSITSDRPLSYKQHLAFSRICTKYLKTVDNHGKSEIRRQMSEEELSDIF